MIKRTIAVLMTVAMMLTIFAAAGSTVSAAEMHFKDVKAGSWYYDTVKYVYDNGIMNGMTDDTFSPNGKLTRAMFITILGRLAGAEQSESDVFSDVKKGTWYSGYVGWAVNVGVVNGYSDGTFKPQGYLTRQEMAAAMARYIDQSGVAMPRESTAPVTFADESSVANWAKDYVEVLRRAGIVNGDNKGKYNPKANITRAETATIIKNLVDAGQKAWQGYVPDPEEDGYAVYGASYLYNSGHAVSGGLGTKLVTGSDGYMLLSAYPDEDTAAQHLAVPSNTTGICTTVYEDLVPDDLPVIRIAYRYSDGTDTVPEDGYYKVNPAINSWSMNYCNAYADEAFTFETGSDDSGYSTMIYDMSGMYEKYSKVDDRFDMSHILVTPFEEGYTGSETFDILYIGFFADRESAEAFSASSLEDYLKNYYLYSNTDINELDSETKEYYDALLSDRINEILSSESEITPETVKAGGGKCYYVSSLNGKSENSGESPSEAWAETEDMWVIKAGGLVRQSKLKAGDGVFFERGSIFYNKRYGNYSILGLDLSEGVFCGAYGEGDKPIFTNQIDFSDSNGTGNWLSTEWDNIWVLDEIDPREEFRTVNCDLGNMIFNDGEAFGIRVLPEGAKEGNVEPVFAEGKTTRYYSMCTPDGELYYISGGTPCEDPGTALLHNYEYIVDNYNGKLYLYWDKGNPSDSFDSIYVSRLGYCVTTGNNVTIDNICIRCSSTWGCAMENIGCTIMNCEIGYVCGSVSSIESGMEINGESDGVIMKNNYCHDIGDGPLSLQSQGETPGVETSICNVEAYDNVIVSSGNGFEIATNTGTYLIDEDGVAQNKLINLYVHDNILAYIGYGISEWQADGDVDHALARKLGTAMCTGHEMQNCVLENNIFMYCVGSIGVDYYSSDTQQRGWTLKDNTYILDPEYVILCERRDSFNRTWQSNLSNYGIKVQTPVTERYISYMESIGIGNREKYYLFSDKTEAHDLRCFFMTGTVAREMGK